MNIPHTETHSATANSNLYITDTVSTSNINFIDPPLSKADGPPNFISRSVFLPMTLSCFFPFFFFFFGYYFSVYEMDFDDLVDVLEGRSNILKFMEISLKIISFNSL